MGKAEPQTSIASLAFFKECPKLVLFCPMRMLSLGPVNILVATSCACVCWLLVKTAPSGRPWNVANVLGTLVGALVGLCCSNLHLWVQAKMNSEYVKWVIESSVEQFSMHKSFSGWLPTHAVYVPKYYSIQIFWLLTVGKVLEALQVK